MHRRKPPERRGKAGVKAATGPLNRPDQGKRRARHRRLCVFGFQAWSAIFDIRLKAMGRSVLASGELGQHNGLPATVIVVQDALLSWPRSGGSRRRPRRGRC